MLRFVIGRAIEQRIEDFGDPIEGFNGGERVWPRRAPNLHKK